MRIYVGNLSFNTDEPTIEALFAPLGTVESVKLIRDHATGRSRGFGFVEMEGADAAIAALDRKEFGGRVLTVNEARPRNDNGPRRSNRW